MKWTLRLQFFGLGVSAILLAFAYRALGGRVNCPSDERNWTLIAEQINQGVDWPISGPLHFWLVQTLVHYSGLSQAQAFSFAGTWSVPLLVVLMTLAYAQLGIKKPINLLVVLACSTYFLAPLLESRPQQWGQVLVLLGGVLGWRAIHRLSAWWPYLLVLFITAGVHILSFAILAANSLVVWVILYVLGQTSWITVARLLMCLIPGLLLYLIPDGPYAAMLVDLRLHHLTVPLDGGAMVLALMGLAALGGWGVQQLRQRVAPVLGGAFSVAERRPVLVGTGISLLAFGTLGLQAWMLPAEAWAPYKGSFVLFGVSQTGNLFFFGLSLGGLLAAHQSHQQGRDQAQQQALVVLLCAISLIALAALVLSFWMLHTNWLLRALNYVCLFLAPFAALGFEKFKHTALKWGVWGTASAISFFAVVRPTAFFAC